MSPATRPRAFAILTSGKTRTKGAIRHDRPKSTCGGPPPRPRIAVARHDRRFVGDRHLFRVALRQNPDRAVVRPNSRVAGRGAFAGRPRTRAVHLAMDGLS